MNRREFIQFLIAGCAAGIIRPSYGSASVDYDFKPFGNLRLIHITDTHAQLDPMYFREPNFNLGVGSNRNMPPHIIGKKLLDYYSIDSTLLKHAYTHLEFNKHARKYGKFGGYTHLKTLIDLLKSQVNNNALLLDGGDTWQGSGLSLLENGKDIVKASNLLGVDVMTGHWEFTFGEEIFLENLKNFNGDFVAQNISLTEEAIFDGLEAVDDDNHLASQIEKISNKNVINNIKPETNDNIKIFNSIKSLCKNSSKQKLILISLPSNVVDTCIDELMLYLNKNDIIADLGNSFFLDTRKRFLKVQEKQINFLGIGFIAGSPTEIGNPGFVTVPTPGPALNIIPDSVSSTLTFIKAPCVTSGSSPASFIIPTSTQLSFFSKNEILNVGFSPFGNVIVINSTSSPAQRAHRAALVAAVAHAPVVQPLFNLVLGSLLIFTLYAEIDLSPIFI